MSNEEATNVNVAETNEEKPAHLYDADDDGIPDEMMFDGSTHGFAIFFAEKRDISRLIIAYFVFAMQMVLYIVCMNQVIGDLSGNEFTIPVSVRFGKKCTDEDNLGTLSIYLLQSGIVGWTLFKKKQ